MGSGQDEEERDRDHEDQAPEVADLVGEGLVLAVVALRQHLVRQWICGGERRRLALEEFCGRRRSVPDLTVSGGGGAGSLQELSLLFGLQLALLSSSFLSLPSLLKMQFYEIF